jgi:hypothetical protein
LLRELARVSRRGFLFTAWPAAEEEGVVEEREQVGATEFPHRRYPCSRLMADIVAALPNAALDLEIAILHGDVWAYVVARGASGPAGLTGPRLVPIPGFGQRLLAHAASRASQR